MEIDEFLEKERMRDSMKAMDESISAIPYRQTFRGNWTTSTTSDTITYTFNNSGTNQ